MKKFNELLTVHQIALASLIAALYAGFSIMLAPISFGPVQFRIAEALTLLPWAIPASVPGLFVGCLLANIIGGYGIIDIALGSAATLLAAWLTSRAPNLWLAALPPVVINALVVGSYIGILSHTPVLWSVLYIGLSQAVICFGTGIPMMHYLKRSAALGKYFTREEKSK